MADDSGGSSAGGDRPSSDDVVARISTDDLGPGSEDALLGSASIVRVTDFERRPSSNGDFVAFKIESKM